MSTFPFRNKLSEDIFNHKYKHDGCETWSDLVDTLINNLNKYPLSTSSKPLSNDEANQLKQFIKEMKFIPGGRYLYYAGRPLPYYNNCYLLRAEEDNREDWANLSWKSESCLVTGGGIGIDYSIYRPRGSTISRTGGIASGPVSKMQMINEIGRHVMQGGARRSAIYASLNWKHSDIKEFMSVKDWDNKLIRETDLSYGELKKNDFDFPCPLDMTNISVNYDTEWLMNYNNTGDVGDVFRENVKHALTHGEPGFSFNFFDKENETLRNACTEVTSEDDSDVCNLGSINMSRIDNISEFCDVITLATKFLLLGTLHADLPYNKIKQVREKNRRLGLGLMGIHEWLLQKGYSYEVVPELHQWLTVYKGISNKVSKEFSDYLSISTPIANRSIAPTGTIGMLAGTTTGIEPLYAIAYKRRYIVHTPNGPKYKYQYAVDQIAQEMIDQYGLKPDEIESAVDLATNYEQRIKFQAEVQDYVDMAISSTINLPSFNNWNRNRQEGKQLLHDEHLQLFTNTLANYAHRLRGFTCYPDGARGGQPLQSIPYVDAIDKLGEEFDEHLEINDVCDITGGGYCGS